MLNSFRSGRILVKLAILAAVCGLLMGGGYAIHKYRKRAAIRDALAAGKEAYAAGRFSAAAAHLGRYLRAHPENTEILLQYAEAQVRRRPQSGSNYQQAVNAYERVLRAQPAHPVAAERVLEVYAALDLRSDAERIARAWLNASANNPDSRMKARRRLVAVLLDAQKYDEADRIINEWIVETPDSPAALSARADLLIARGRAAEAIDPLQAAVDRDPQNVGIASRLAQLMLERKNDRAACEAILNALVERNPESAEARIARGTLLLYLSMAQARPVPEDRARAIEDFEAAEKLAGERLEPLLKLGALYSQSGFREKAVALLQRLETLAPANVNIYTALAEIVLESGDPAASAELADRILAVRFGEERLDLLPLIVELYAAAHRLSDARKVMEDFRRASPSSDLLLYLGAILDRAENRLPESIDKLQDFVRRNPKWPRAQLALGRALVQTGDLRRAAEVLNTYIELDRSSLRIASVSAAQIELARLYVRLGRWEEAARVADQLSPRVPDPRLSFEIHLNRIELEAQIARFRPGGPDLARLKQLEESLLGVIRQHPQPGTLTLLHARLVGWQGRLDEAARMLNPLRDDEKERGRAILALLDLYAEAGQREQAVQICREALAVADAGLAAALRPRLADLYAASQNLDAAREVLEEQAARSSGPARSAAKLQLAHYLIRHRQLDEARRKLLEVIEEDPRNLASRVTLLQMGAGDLQRPSRQELVDQIQKIEGGRGLQARFWQAVVWSEQEDWRSRRKEIESLLDECLAADPSSDAFVLARGEFHIKAGEGDLALQAYLRFLETNRSNRPVALRLLELARQMQRWPELERALSIVPGDDPAFDQYRLALALHEGNVEQAARMLNDRIRANPQDFLSRLQLALLSLQADDLEAAERHIAEAAEIKPDALEILDARVRIHLRKREYDPALQLCESALAKERTADLLLLRARVHEVRGEIEPAASDLREVAGFEGMAERGFLALGMLYARQNDTVRAIESWREATRVLPQSHLLRGNLAGALLRSVSEEDRRQGERLLAELLAEQPGDRTLLILRAEHLSRTDAEAAERAYEQVLRLYPAAREAYLGIAQIAMRSDPPRYSRAQEVIDQGLSIAPGNVDLLLLRSQALLKQGSPQRALLAAEEAWRAQPNDERTAVAVADALTEAGGMDRAIEVLKESLQGASGGRLLYVRLALAYVYTRRGDFQAADALLSAADRFSPGNPLVVRMRLLWHAAQQQWDQISELIGGLLGKGEEEVPTVRQAARLLLSSGSPAQRQKGLEMLRGLVERHPRDAAGYYELGSACYALGRPEETRLAYEKYLDLVPANVRVLNDLAWVVGEDLKDPAGAMKWITRARELRPDDPHVLDTYGVLQYRLGNFQESREALTRCLQLKEVPPRTRLSATLHLGRTLAELDRAESRRVLEQLAADPQVKEILPADSVRELQSLLARLSNNSSS